MSMICRTLFATPTAVALLVATASPVFSLPVGDRTLFTWNGRIDREVLIVIRGRNIETRASGVDASFAPRLEVRDELPRQLGAIDVHLAGGRGSGEIVQQPSARNDYTAIVRVRDTRSGNDEYRVVVSWQAVSYTTDPRDGRDRDRTGNDDRDRDRERDDRDRDRDNRDRDNRNTKDRGTSGWDDRGGYGRDAGRVVWRGDVDDVVDIRIQGRRVEYRTRSGQVLRNVQYNVRGNGLPRRPITLELDVARGRGDVIVVQHPSRSNDFTAIVRIVDRRGGYGNYDFDLRWK